MSAVPWACPRLPSFTALSTAGVAVIETVLEQLAASEAQMLAAELQIRIAKAELRRAVGG